MKTARQDPRARPSPTVAVMALAALALAACEEAKPRHDPPDPFAVAPPPPADLAAQAPQGRSVGLAKRPQMAGFSLDAIGPAWDPLNKQPAVVSAAEPLVLRGFGFDPVARRPGKGVDVVIDGKPYATAYGAGRADVAAYFKTPVLTPVGFRATLPAGLVGVGGHQAVVRVIAADGKGYFDGPPIAFTVRFAEPRRH